MASRDRNKALAKKEKSFRRRIFSQEEIEALSEHLRQAMGPKIVELSQAYGVSIEDSLRFQAVAARLEEARIKKGLTLKEVAAALKVAQYHLGHIEKCSLRNINSEILLRYIEFLGLSSWFGKWRKANVEYSKRMGFVQERKKGRP